MPFGKYDSNLSEVDPAVMTVSPFWILSLLMKSSFICSGLPTSGCRIARGKPVLDGLPWKVVGRTIAETLESLSVMSVTVAVPPVTAVIRPASPSGATTAWLTRTPSFEPLLIVTVEYQKVGAYVRTCATSGSVPSG